MGARRKAREHAFQFLFQLDFDQDNPQEKIELFWQEHPCLPQQQEFAAELVWGTIEQLSIIDRHISKQAINWRLERMAVVDRNILRLATYEILFREDIPPKVSINEALEIAKKYSDTKSAKFINGILDKIAGESGLEKEPEQK